MTYLNSKVYKVPSFKKEKKLLNDIEKLEAIGEHLSNHNYTIVEGIREKIVERLHDVVNPKTKAKLYARLNLIDGLSPRLDRLVKAEWNNEV